MLLTITTTMPSARDLGYLLHKHPDRFQTFELSYGAGHVFYPVASDDRCTAALHVDVDPIKLTRGPRGRFYRQEHYVNDRQYVASSFMSVAISRIFSTAMAGRCESHPELAASRLPLEASVPVVSCSGNVELIKRMFEPLGYDVSAELLPLAVDGPDWGTSRYCKLSLKSEIRLQDLLTHLYVLLPVLDDEKHYWVGDEEVDKLLRRGEGWLENHPARTEITRRYLRRRRPLVMDALSKLVTAEVDESPPEPGDTRHVETFRTLHQQRLGAALGAIRQSGARTVVDLGCGEGRLLELLRAEKQFERITGVDASHRSLDRASRRLRLESAPASERERIRLIHGALTYRDDRLRDHDAAAVIEVIEHLDQDRLSAFSASLFQHARPRTVVLTTPNREYNILFDEPRELRHGDHRFEWTRDEFSAWAHETATAHGYTVSMLPVGAEDPDHGAPSQMAVFERRDLEAGQ